MKNKLTALFTLMAVVVLLGTWTARWILGRPTMDTENAMMIVILVMFVSYLFFGRMVSWIGINLIQEEMAERRVREEELRHQLRMIEQETASADEKEEAAPAEGEEGEAEEA